MTRDEHNATVWDASRSMGEQRDCTIKALAIATGLHYDDVHAAAAKQGRKRGKGMKRHQTIATAKALGFALEHVTDYRAKTARTIERDKCLQSGAFIIGMTRHLAAMVDGKLIDWSQNGLKRINGVYSVTPITTAELQAVPFRPFKRYTKHDQIPLF